MKLSAAISTTLVVSAAASCISDPVWGQKGPCDCSCYAWTKWALAPQKDDQGECFCDDQGKVHHLGCCEPDEEITEVVEDMMPTSLASSGHMSVLGGSVVDGKCEYAGTTHGGAKSTAATSPHVVSGRYCGVSEKMFAGGASCGACYKVSYSGEGGTNPGHAGSAVVQVVNQASEVFACHKDVFHTITGATTGIFPITYTEVACEVDSAVGVATVLDGKNAYYTKAIFSDLPHAVSSAKLKIGEKSFHMDRVAGATFKANTDGSQASASFELTLADGSINKLAPCFKSWPVATDSSCAPAAVNSNSTVV